MRGNLHNKGQGPAKDVLVYLNKRLGEGEAGAFRLTRPVVVSGLVAAGEMIEVNVAITDRDEMHIWKENAWHPVRVFHAIAGEAYEVVLEYQDAFSNIFRTVHSRGIWTSPVPNLGDPATREQVMIRQNKPMPAFLIGRQAVRTLADLSPPPTVSTDEMREF
jgi:hypothetical protein